MKNLKLYFFIIILCLTYLSCKEKPKGHANKVEVSGKILDKKSGFPIKSARVTALCWREIGFDDETYDKVDTLTNENGEFTILFEQGYKIDIAAVSSGYNPSKYHISEISSHSDKIIIHLTKKTGLDGVDAGYISTFFRKYANLPLPESYGIDLINARNTISIDSADILPIISAGDKYPTIFSSNENGGIIPILRGGDISIAPSNGYLRSYKLVGNEKGFFVKCRDGKTFARLVIFSLNNSKSGYISDSVYFDYGIMFKAFIQKGGYNVFNFPDDIVLDEYLLRN
jgi:hypothetical protein